MKSSINDFIKSTFSFTEFMFEQDKYGVLYINVDTQLVLLFESIPQPVLNTTAPILL